MDLWLLSSLPHLEAGIFQESHQPGPGSTQSYWIVIQSQRRGLDNLEVSVTRVDDGTHSLYASYTNEETVKQTSLHRPVHCCRFKGGRSIDLIDQA